jgi:hypothetical protein
MKEAQAMAMNSQTGDPVTKREIFLSYASADKGLSDKLSRALENNGQEVWVDTEDIRYAENWRDAVFPAIERAPAVLFITSRASLESENCLEELKYAESLGKRIIPIVAERVEELPKVLKDRVRRDFRDAELFDEELLRLVQDVTSDPEYVDTHTHLAYRAARWRAEKTDLLGAKELKRADDWLARAQSDTNIEPRPTRLITDFIQASWSALRRRRLKTGALLLAIVAVLGGGYLGVRWWLGIPRSGVDIHLRDGDEAVRQRTADGIARLREALRATIPDKSDRRRLLIATWNIRDLGEYTRPDEALHYIAEIISYFDVVAVQELKADLTDFDRIRQILGRGWRSLESDINEVLPGDRERLAFFFDSRKVTVGRLIGELELRENPEGVGRPYRSPYFVSFKFGGIELAFCNIHLRWGSEVKNRSVMMGAIAAELARKVERGRDFPPNFVLLGDVQGGSDKGRILEGIEEAGFLLPVGLRNLPSVQSGRPYDQIALMLDPASPLQVGTGNVFDFYRFVYTDDQADTYASQVEGFPGAYRNRRGYLMSDHFPKWLELLVGETAR